MKSIKIQQIDYRYVLVENYKNLGLSEKELVILLLIDNTSKEGASLITAEQLALKMTIDEKELDALLVSLIDRKFLVYEQNGGILVTSLKPTFDRIIECLKQDAFFGANDDIEDSDENSTVFKTFEQKLNRSLTPMEFDVIRGWFVEGISKENILSALEECALKKPRITLKDVDRTILKNLKSKDRMKEGYSAVNEINKKDIEKTIEIASYDWVNKK